MALIKCKECGGQVSDTAQNCPHCGAKVPRKTKLLHKVFAGLVLLVVLFGVVVSNSGGPAPASAHAPKAAKDPQAEREFNQVVAALRSIKHGMKNPDSFEVVQALMVPGPTLCITYRGTNGFNAVVTSFVAVWDKGNSTDAAVWNKRCAKKDGVDYTYARRAL